ncbi:hypothetical protein INR49_015527, partial [Caranx melampygus]
MQTATLTYKTCNRPISYTHTDLSSGQIHLNHTGEKFGFVDLLSHQKITMWVLGKIRESVESIPVELSRYMGKSEEDLFLSSKTTLSHSLHNNILTPDNIPEFCLPPRLCKRRPPLETETIPPHLHSLTQKPKSSSSANNTHVKRKGGEASVTWKATQKPLPFSAEGYGLAGIYESPNTRRKESLFHAKRPVYLLDRGTPTLPPRLVKETTKPKKTLSGFFPLFSCKSLSETGSTESETPSSSESSPLSSPYSAKSSLYIPTGTGRLKGASSCPSLIVSKEDKEMLKRGDIQLTTSISNPSKVSKGNSLTLAPPVLFPLDVL